MQNGAPSQSLSGKVGFIHATVRSELLKCNKTFIGCGKTDRKLNDSTKVFIFNTNVFFSVWLVTSSSFGAEQTSHTELLLSQLHTASSPLRPPGRELLNLKLQKQLADLPGCDVGDAAQLLAIKAVQLLPEDLRVFRVLVPDLLLDGMDHEIPEGSAEGEAMVG